MDKNVRRLTQEELEYFAHNLSELRDDGLINEDDEDNDLDSLQICDSYFNSCEEKNNEDVFDIEKMPMIILPDSSPDDLFSLNENADCSNLDQLKEKPVENNMLNSHIEENQIHQNNNELYLTPDREESSTPNQCSSPRRLTRKRKAADNKENVCSNLQKNKTSSNKMKKNKTKEALERLQWKEGNLMMRENAIKFLGSEKLAQSLHESQTPYEFFRYFFDDSLIATIVEQSNLFSIQIRPNAPAKLTELDIKRYIGVCILMSVIHLPSVRSYWSQTIGVDIIKSTMSQKHFEKIRQNLHFNDNTRMVPRDDENHDRLHKIRPVINHLITKFQTVAFESCLSIDEQMCATKAKNYLRQYMPAKPHKWGYKLFVLSGVSGFSYNFEVYTGQENKPNIPEEDLGACANIVVRLLQNIPRDKNYRVYFDNYYTTIQLLVQLAHHGIHSLGTMRRNRIPKCPLPSDDMKKTTRGESREFLTEMDGVPLSSVIWKDNKSVVLVSTFAGTLPKCKVERYDKKCNTKIEVDCPQLVKEYNKHMGGVDLLDSLIGRYRIKIKSRKWYFRLFYHLLDMTVVNSWLLYKRVAAERGESNLLGLADFRIEVGQALCMMGIHRNSQRGRKSDMDKKLQYGIRAGTSSLPPKDVRTDHESHFDRQTFEVQIS